MRDALPGFNVKVSDVIPTRPTPFLVCAVALIALSIPAAVRAQDSRREAAPVPVKHFRFRTPPQFVSVAAGYGLSSPYDDDVPNGDGFYAQGEYILVPSAWFSPRAYAGALITFPKTNVVCSDQDIHCNVSSKMGFLGVKGRLTIPIPYVAPYLELGIGASIGAMTTRTPATDEKMTGITYHIPLGVGLSLGEHHNWDLGFAYLFHPSEKQVGGAVAIGFSFQVAGPPVR